MLQELVELMLRGPLEAYADGKGGSNPSSFCYNPTNWILNGVWQVPIIRHYRLTTDEGTAVLRCLNYIRLKSHTHTGCRGLVTYRHHRCRRDHVGQWDTVFHL